MKRWFNSSKTYELSGEQITRGSNRESKSKATSPEVKVVTASPLLSKKGDDDISVSLDKNGESSVSITVKETTVESAKRSHRRQKSSGNWQMLLGETNKPSPTSTLESQKSGADGATKNPSPRPVRVPVSSKEARPLSFFQKISIDDEPILRQDAKPKKSEIFPWGESQTPSPSPSTEDSRRFVPITDSSPDVTDKILPLQGNTTNPVEISDESESEYVKLGSKLDDERKKLKDYKAQLSHISQSLEDETPQDLETDSGSAHLDKSLVVDLNNDSVEPCVELDSSEHDPFNYSEKIAESHIDQVTSLHTTDVTVDEPLLQHVHDNLSTGSDLTCDDSTTQPDGFSETISEHDNSPATTPKQNSRAIHELEQHHVKRNSDPLSMKKKRRQSASKRKSFPLAVGDSMDSNSELKCEVLKISTVDIDVTPKQDEAFVLVDPALQNTEGHVRRVSVKSFNEIMPEEPEVTSDTESERYRLAMATSETLIDTTTSEDSLTSAEQPDTEVTDGELEKPKLDLLHPVLPLARLRRSVYNSNHELSSLANVRSLDESSACESERGSQHSFRSSLSNKSYSVNDLTQLERPAGFGTLDMNRLVGSLQMLDNILSEHTAATRKLYSSALTTFV